MDFIDGFVLHDDNDEEERQQKRRKKVDGVAIDNKAVKTLKSVMLGRAVELTVWVVKVIFGYNGDKDIGQMPFPRTWSNRYSRFVPESINDIPSCGPDGFKTKYFLEPYQGKIQALIEILYYKQGGRYASVELLENLIAIEDKGNHNWAPFVMKSFRWQMNPVKKIDRRLTNFKGAEWVDVLL
jgi:hypothetical protein